MITFASCLQWVSTTWHSQNPQLLTSWELYQVPYTELIWYKIQIVPLRVIKAKLGRNVSPALPAPFEFFWKVVKDRSLLSEATIGDIDIESQALHGGSKALEETLPYLQVATISHFLDIIIGEKTLTILLGLLARSSKVFPNNVPQYPHIFLVVLIICFKNFLAHDKLLESISRKATILVSKCCSFRFHCCNNIPWISAFTCALSINC